MIKKLIFYTAIGFLIGSFLPGCTAQKPVAQAPVYNITYTDNSQTITGDNNKPVSKPDTSTAQTAKPKVDAGANNTSSGMWKFWLIFTGVLIIVVYIWYRKKGKTWIENLIKKYIK